MPAFIVICYHLYFFYLLPDADNRYLWYLDALAAVCLFIFLFLELLTAHRKEKYIKELLSADTLILPQLSDWENRELIEHDNQILSRQIDTQFQMNCDLQDYVAKAVHEIKVPLSACMLMAENLPETDDRAEMLWQLNRINVQLRLSLLGVKVQGCLFDVQIRPVRLSDIVKTALHNNQFFLINMHFDIRVKVRDEIIHTDASYLVYVLDQMLSNAIKYAGENPYLCITSKRDDIQKADIHKNDIQRTNIQRNNIQRNSIQRNSIRLIIEDHGEGIVREDLERIFQKGYTGHNHRNGRYKSTGMGLYLAKEICHRLGCEINVESEYGCYTRFMITFPDEDFP